MRLSHSDRALISREKIVDYLLSPEHPEGKYKAAWFVAFGFVRESWTEMATALVRHARDNDIAEQRDSDFGVLYIVDGWAAENAGRPRSCGAVRVVCRARRDGTAVRDGLSR